MNNINCFGAQKHTGLYFFDWEKAFNAELAKTGNSMNKLDARYWFNRGYSPETAAALFVADKTT